MKITEQYRSWTSQLVGLAGGPAILAHAVKAHTPAGATIAAKTRRAVITSTVIGAATLGAAFVAPQYVPQAAGLGLGVNLVNDAIVAGWSAACGLASFIIQPGYGDARAQRERKQIKSQGFPTLPSNK
jgi:hypothetical protein